MGIPEATWWDLAIRIGNKSGLHETYRLFHPDRTLTDRTGAQGERRGDPRGQVVGSCDPRTVLTPRRAAAEKQGARAGPSLKQTGH